MAVQSSDIKYYLTGASSDGGVQVDPNVSLGSYRGSEIVDAVANNVFDDVSNIERISGDTEYRCICVKNINVTDSFLNPKIFIEVDTGNVEEDISFAVEVPSGGDTNGSAQTIINESAVPVVGVGNVSSWSDATSKITGIGINQGAHDSNLDAGEIVFIWIRRIISVQASSVNNSAVTIKIEGDVGNNIEIKWSILAFGTPNIEFWFPDSVPSEYVRIYHGVSNNSPNRKIIKKIRMGVSAGGVYTFRNVGYSDELIKLDIVLSTKEEAEEFTNFFIDTVRGMSNIFYYRNNFTGQESRVRFMHNDLAMGAMEGHPYSFSILMRKELSTVRKGAQLTVKWDFLASGGGGPAPGPGPGPGP